MSFNEKLAGFATPISIEPSSTSYFSHDLPTLDPLLFHGNSMVGSVRNNVLMVLFNHLRAYYYNPEAYVQAWIAGSGVSYQWAAHRDPGDLDCLVGIDFVAFRRANAAYEGLSNHEIADMLNDDFRTFLWPQTENFMGAFELTFYVNVASDIKVIKPYAAYSLTNDGWTVEPTHRVAPDNPSWKLKSDRDLSMGQTIVDRYSEALAQLSTSKVSTRVNAEAKIKMAADQGSALFDDIHSGRKFAFSENGSGYEDYNNYRWQAGKKSGLIHALRTLKDISEKTRQEFDKQTYGVELPDTSTLIRRALHRN